MARINAGYEITDRISISRKHYVLGEHQNPEAPAPFVTWETDDELKFFYRGHYFVDRSEAQLDLFRRSSQELKLEGRTPGIALLTKDDRWALYREFTDNKAREQIAYVLTDTLENESVKYDYNALLADPHFMAKAIHRYDNIDHSYENEALQDALLNLLEDFPHYKLPEKGPLSAELRISPEMNDLIKDLLNLPAAVVAEKYGPLGDNYEFVFPFGNDVEAILSVRPVYEPGDPNKLSADKSHYMYLEAYDENGSLICSHILTEKEWAPDPEKGGIAGQCEVPFYDESTTLTLRLLEDEALRRVGNRFVFNCSSEDEHYMLHDKEVCSILRGLTSEECDVLCTGLMWEAEFPNGDRIHVFDYELGDPSQEHSQKPALSAQIQAADHRNTMAVPAESKQPQIEDLTK